MIKSINYKKSFCTELKFLTSVSIQLLLLFLWLFDLA